MTNSGNIIYTVSIKPIIRYIAKIANFTITESLLTRLRIEDIGITSTTNLKTEMFSDLEIEDIGISSSGKVNVELIETVHIDDVNMSFIPKSSVELFTTNSTQIEISSLGKRKVQNSLALGLGNISFSITGTVAELLPLSLYDPQTLGVLDLLTLDEMDRT